MTDALSYSISDPGTLSVAVAMACAFGAVFFFVVGVNAYIGTRSDVKRRSILDRGLASQAGGAGQEWFQNADFSKISEHTGDISAARRRRTRCGQR